MTNQKKKAGIKLVTLILVIFIAILATVTVLIQHIGSAKMTASKPALTNLNITDINQTIKGASYTPYEVNNTSLLSNNTLGSYKAYSISVFNATKATLNSTNQSYPYYITSGVFLMSNSSSAYYGVNSLIFSNNANQTFVRSASGTNYTSYTYNNYTTDIYEVYSIAVYNGSQIRPYESNLPDYQYITIFAYKNYLCTVVTNSKTNALSANIAIELSEALLGKLYGIKTSGA